MAHIAYVSTGMLSTLNGTLELLTQAHAAGHRVTLISHRELREQSLPHSFRFVHLTVLDELRMRAAALSIPGNLNPVRWWQWWNQRRSLWRESLDNEEIECAVKDLAPDLVLLDIEAHYAIIATHGLDVPRVLVNFFLDVNFVAGVPPLSTALTPDRHTAAEIANAIRDCRSINRGWVWRNRLSKRGLSRGLRAVGYDTVVREELTAVAKAKQFPLQEEIDDQQWLRPWTYRRLPIMVLNLAELDFPHPFADNLNFVGPQVNSRALDIDDELRYFLAGASGPLVYCSLGTYFRQDATLLQRIIRVFAKRRDWRLVIGLGGRELETSVPDNVLALRWAPQSEVLKQADCAILHGGISGINEALSSGTPMLLYSGGAIDQPGNTARVGYRRLGIVGDGQNDDETCIVRHIEMLLEDERIRDNVHRLQTLIEHYRRSGSAVRFIESQLGTVE